MNGHKIIDLTDKSIYSTSDAIKAAGLNWTVDKGPLFTRTYWLDSEGNKTYGQRELTSQKSVHLTSNGDPLGSAIVGKSFTLVQNEEAFNCFDQILTNHKAQFISGGYYHNGGSVFLQCRLPHQTPMRNGDTTERYLLIAQGHTIHAIQLHSPAVARDVPWQ